MSVFGADLGGTRAAAQLVTWWTTTYLLSTYVGSMLAGGSLRMTCKNREESTRF